MLDPGYDRPPYRVEEPPPSAAPPQLKRRRPVARWALELVFPWLLAKRFYGPYRMLRFSAAALVNAGGPVLGGYVQPMAGAVAEQAVDPVIERLLLPRALLGLGVVLLLVRLFTGTSMNDLLDETFGDSIVVLLTGPISLVLVCAAVVALARHGARLRVSRMVVRPLLTGVLTAGVFVLVFWMEQHPDVFSALGPGASPLLGLLLFAFSGWAIAFVFPAMYLMHRNAFAVRAHPLVRPLTSILLVWLTALGHAVLIDSTTGVPHTTAWLLGLIAGPVGVTVTAVIELVLLRRDHRVGFRGPLPRLGEKAVAPDQR